MRLGESLLSAIAESLSDRTEAEGGKRKGRRENWKGGRCKAGVSGETQSPRHMYLADHTLLASSPLSSVQSPDPT